MRVLVVEGFSSDDPDRVLVETALAVLETSGHEVSVVSTHDVGFMTTEEREAYESDEPLVSPAMAAAADEVQQTDALLFCYPSRALTVPSSMKSWLERVLVPGVAFVFDDRNKMRPGLTNVKRLGAITTVARPVGWVRGPRDLGRRTVMRTLRLNCHQRCRRTYLRFPRHAVDTAAIEEALSRW